MMRQNCLIKPDDVVAHWGTLRPLLVPAVAAGNGEMLVDDIVDLVKAGRLFIAAALEDGVPTLLAVCEFCDYPRMRALNVLYMGGQDVRWDNDWSFLEGIARDYGASIVQGWCPERIARLILRVSGGKARYVNVVREVGNG